MRYTSKILVTMGLCGLQANGAPAPQAAAVSASDSWQRPLHECFNLMNDAEQALKGSFSLRGELGLSKLSALLLDTPNCVFIDFERGGGLGNHTLWNAAIEGEHSELFKFFLNSGAQLSIEDVNEDRPRQQRFFRSLLGKPEFLKLFVEHAVKTAESTAILDQQMSTDLRKFVIEPFAGMTDLKYIRDFWRDEVFNVYLGNVNQALAFILGSPAWLHGNCSALKKLIEYDIVPNDISALKETSQAMKRHAIKRLGVSAGFLAIAALLFYVSKFDSEREISIIGATAFLALSLKHATHTATVSYDTCTLSRLVQDLIQRQEGNSQQGYGTFEEV